MAIISSKKHLLWCHIMAAIMRFSFMRNFCCCRDAQTEQLFNRLSWVLTPVMWLLQHSVSKLLRSFIPDVELFYSCLSLEWSSLCIFMLNPWIYNFFSRLIFTAWPATVQFCLFHFPTTGRWPGAAISPGGLTGLTGLAGWSGGVVTSDRLLWPLSMCMY